MSICWTALLLTGIVELYVYGLWRAAQAVEMVRGGAKEIARLVVTPSGD